MWYHNQFSTLDTVRKEAAGYSGLPVRVAYGDGYAVGQTSDGYLTLTIPKGATLIDPEFSAGVFHESMHVRFSDMHLIKDNLTALCIKAGLQESDIAWAAESLHTFMNAFEDVRIERKGSKMFPGAHSMLKETYRDMLWNRYLPMSYAYVPKMEPIKAYVDYVICSLNGYINTSEKLSAKMRKESGLTNSMISSSLRVNANRGFAKIGKELEDTKTSYEAMMLGYKHFWKSYARLIVRDTQSKTLAFEQIEKILAELGAGELAGNMSKGNAAGVKPLEESGALPGTPLQAHAGQWFDFKKYKQEILGGRAANTLDCVNAYVKELRPLVDDIRAWQLDVRDEGGFKRGRLDRYSLHRVAMGDDDVFTRKHSEEYNDDIAYAFAIDVSGSMFSDSELSPIVIATACGAALSETLHAIGRPSAIATFDAAAYMVKELGDHVPRRDLVQRLHQNGGGGTNILRGYAMAKEQIDKATEKDKVVLLITDGDVDSTDLDDIKQNMKGVHVYFITIGDKDLLPRIAAKFPKDCYSYTQVRSAEIKSLSKSVIDFTRKLMKKV